MNRLEKFSTIFLIAGFISFIFAFVFLGVWPAIMTGGIPEDGGFPKEIPRNFQVYYKTLPEYHKALIMGRDIYVKEACWHCHSQYVRPVGGESVYYGAISTPIEYENELNRPQLFGTRRVGPDLTREADKRTNDWHFAHLYNPKLVVVDSIMPGYPWYYDESQNPPAPTEEAIALVAYLQSLGKWVSDTNRDSYDLNQITMPPAWEE